MVFMGLDGVAGELYGLPPADFVTARDARAAQARRQGDRDLADALKKLRRPSTGAWLANLLVRERHDQVAGLLAVGAALRQAQAQLDHEDLRRLSKERRRVVATLAEQARVLARERGQAVSDAGSRELESTLEAAVLDAGAASELATGRLTAALRYSGLGWSGSAEPSPPGTEDLPPGPAAPTEGGTKSQAEPKRAEHQGRAAAAGALRSAQAAVAAAGRELGQRQRRAEEARRERDRQRQELADLEDRVAEARAAGQQAELELDVAEKELAGAQRQAQAAQDNLATAQAGLSLFSARAT